MVQALEAGREETREFVSWRVVGGSMHVALHKQTLSVRRLIQKVLCSVTHHDRVAYLMMDGRG